MAGEAATGPDRDPALDEIRQKYQAGDVVLFVGAGVSAAAGLPSWAELVRRLVARAKVRGEATDEMEALAAGGRYVDAISAAEDAVGGPELIAVVKDALDDSRLVREVPEVGKAIASLEPRLRAVLTTNLDRLLERAFEGRWSDYHEAEAAAGQERRFILKLHGTLREPKTWVLTRSQYDRALYNDPLLQDLLGGLFRTMTLVFVGYGLADDDFDEILKRIRALSGGSPPRHYALVLRAQVKEYWRKVREEAGVRVVPYAAHADVPVILRWLSALDTPPTPAPVPVPVPAAAPGALPPPPGASYDARWYVRRPEEEAQALANLDAPGTPVVLWGPDGIGKGMLLGYLLERVRQADGAGARIVEVDLSLLVPEPRESATLDGLLENLAAYIIDQTGGDGAWLDEMGKKRFPWPVKFSMLVERVLKASPQRLVLAIRKADDVWGLPFQSAFYRTWRSLCEKAHNEPWSRLRLVLVLSSAPGLVFEGPDHQDSPWNLAEDIEAKDFKPAQTAEMARLHRLDWTADAIERVLFPLVGGHPRLLHVLMQRARLSGTSLDDLVKDPESIEDLFADELREVARVLERDGRREDAVRRLLDDEKSAIDEDILLRLRRGGIIDRVPGGGGHRIRYGLYKDYLRRRWQAKPRA